MHSVPQFGDPGVAPPLRDAFCALREMTTYCETAGSVAEDSNEENLDTANGDGAYGHAGIAPSARPAPKKRRQNGGNQPVEAEMQICIM